MLVLQWQKPIELIAESGIHCFVPYGKTFRYINTSINTVELTNKVIADKIGFDFQNSHFSKKTSLLSFKKSSQYLHHDCEHSFHSPFCYQIKTAYFSNKIDMEGGGLCEGSLER